MRLLTCYPICSYLSSRHQNVLHLETSSFPPHLYTLTLLTTGVLSHVLRRTLMSPMAPRASSLSETANDASDAPDVGSKEKLEVGSLV